MAVLATCGHSTFGPGPASSSHAWPTEPSISFRRNTVASRSPGTLPRAWLHRPTTTAVGAHSPVLSSGASSRPAGSQPSDRRVRTNGASGASTAGSVSYTHLRAHETRHDL